MGLLCWRAERFVRVRAKALSGERAAHVACVRCCGRVRVEIGVLSRPLRSVVLMVVVLDWDLAIIIGEDAFEARQAFHPALSHNLLRLQCSVRQHQSRQSGWYE